MRRVLALALAATAAAPLAAQEFTADFCRGRMPVRVGMWSSYRFTGGPSDGSTMRLAVVGSEQAGDSTFFWYENRLGGTRNGKPQNAVIQVLMGGLGTPEASVHGLVMKQGDGPAMRAPDMMIAMLARSVTQGVNNFVAQHCKSGSVESLGMESVTVPAGTYRALHVRTSDGTEAWVSRDFGVFGVVKAVTKDGGQMTLTGRGTDARSSITETPQPMMGH